MKLTLEINAHVNLFYLSSAHGIGRIIPDEVSSGQADDVEARAGCNLYY